MVPDNPRPLLERFVADIDAVFAKNTNRRFVLSPTDTLVRTSEFSFQGSHNYPIDDYPIYICMEPGDRTHGGWCQVHPSGATMSMMLTPRMHNLVDGPPGWETDYGTQLHISHHEIAHGCGVAIGEDYDRAMIDDPTGVEPLCPVNSNNPNDILWGRLSDYAADPMLHYGPGGRFSDHNARVISGPYRISQHMVPLAPLDQCSVLVQDEGIPIAEPWPLSGIRVRVWHVDSHSPTCVLLADRVTDSTGRVPFTWPDNPNSNDSVLVKCHGDGYAPSVGWLTQPDLESAGMDGELLEAVARMKPARPEFTPQIRLAAVTGAPGLVQISGLSMGLRFEILAGPFGEEPKPVARLAAMGPEMTWTDPRPMAASMIYRVRTIPQTGQAATPAVRRATLDRMGDLCRMCGQRTR